MFALLFCAFAIAPALIYVIDDVDFVSRSSESIAYRYFFHERMGHSGEGLPILWQGYTTLLLQKIPFLLSQAFFSDIYARINAFSILYAAMIAALHVALILWCWRYRETWFTAAVFTPLFLAIYLPQTGSGVYYYTAPDYYAASSLIVASAAVLAGTILADGTMPPGRILCAGLLLGAALANKISLAPIALAPLAAAWIVRTSWRSRLRDTAALTALALGAFTAIYVLNYGLRLRHAWKAMTLPFVSDLSGGIAPVSLSQFARQYLAFDDLGRPFSLCLILIALGTATAFQRPGFNGLKRNFLPLYIISVLSAGTLAAFVRPAGTTIFEVLVCCSGLAALAASAGAGSRWTKTGVAAALCVLMWYTPATLAVLRGSTQQSKERGLALQAFTRTLRASGGDIYFYYPDDNYHVGSLEETMLKAASDFPTWTISSGQKMIDRIYPGLHIITGLHPSAIDVSTGSTVAWIYKKYPGFADPLDLYPTFARLAHAPGAECGSIVYAIPEYLRYCRTAGPSSPSPQENDDRPHQPHWNGPPHAAAQD